MVIKQYTLCYDGELPTNNSEKKHLLKHKEIYKISKKLKQICLRAQEKIDFALVFTDITRKGASSEEASIHTAEMAAIKVALKEMHKRKNKRGNIYMYRLSELCADH